MTLRELLHDAHQIVVIPPLERVLLVRVGQKQVLELRVMLVLHSHGETMLILHHIPKERVQPLRDMKHVVLATQGNHAHLVVHHARWRQGPSAHPYANIERRVALYVEMRARKGSKLIGQEIGPGVQVEVLAVFKSVLLELNLVSSRNHARIKLPAIEIQIPST